MQLNIFPYNMELYIYSIEKYLVVYLFENI